MEVYGDAFIGGTIRGDKKEEYLPSGGKVTQIIAKTYAKARMEGYATPDTTLKDRNVIKQKLGQGYSYSISIIDSKDTIQRLKKLYR